MSEIIVFKETKELIEFLEGFHKTERLSVSVFLPLCGGKQFLECNENLIGALKRKYNFPHSIPYESEVLLFS